MSLTKVTYAMIQNAPINIVDFGADPTGTTECSAAIQSAIDYALANNFPVTGTGTFKISSKVVIKCNANFTNATFNVYNTPEYAVEVSTGNATDPTTTLGGITVYLPTIVNKTKPATGWVGQKYGVRTVNLNQSNVYVNPITGFLGNLLITSFGGNGNAYNNYFLTMLENGKVNLKLYAGDSTSWVNENNFYGGRLNQNTNEGTAITDCVQIYISAVPVGWVGTPNNNVFYKPSLEGDAPIYHVVNGGSNNTFINARWETYINPPKVLYYGEGIAGQGSYNTIFYGYASEAIEFTYSGVGTGPVYNAYYSNKFQDFGVNGGFGIGIQNQQSSDSAIHTFFEAGTRPETASANVWTMMNTAQNLRGKVSTDAYARVQLNYQTGQIKFGNGTAAPTVGLFGSGTDLYVNTNATSLIPLQDNHTALGAGSYRYSVVYAATGTINTSDEREKQDIAELDEAEKQVAVKLKSLVKKFRFKDAVKEKGDAARIHVGVIAQEVMAAFESEGLDATRYGVLCYDEWEASETEIDENDEVVKPAKEAGNRYGVRYEELFAFILGAL